MGVSWHVPTMNLTKNIVDVTTDEIVETFKGHKARVESLCFSSKKKLCFSSDGPTLTSGARDKRDIDLS
jgi:WD40 repeat protein